ncbi:MAG: 6-bladed beta-propeller [Bacteroidales bacterium]|nr:6-bladed beta-propeller [Bacteroidales bacterium]
MKIAIYFFAILLTACNTNKQELNDLRLIDVAGAVNNSRTVNLSEIADSIEYIPLETRKESLIGIIHGGRIFREQELIYIPVLNEGVRVFNKKGEFINTIHKEGRGPEEYGRYLKNNIDHVTGNIYIQGSRIIIEYKYNGDFVRKINLPEYSMGDTVRFVFFRDFGNYLLITSDLALNSRYSAFVTDTTFNIIMKIEYPKEEQEFVKKINYRRPPSTDPRIFKYGDKIRIINGHNKNILSINKDLSIDTAFILNYGKYDAKNSKTPLNPDSPYLWQRLDAFESDDYLFLKMHVGTLLKKPTILLDVMGKEFNYNHSCSFFNKKTGKFTFLDQPLPYQLGFNEDFEGGPAFWPKYVSADNYMISIISAIEFKSFADKNNVSQKYKALADKLKESDNHVLIKVKLKNCKR